MTAAIFHGKSCGTCGSTERYGNGRCRPCALRRATAANKDRTEYKKAWARRKRARNPVAAREQDRIRRARLSPALRAAGQRRFIERNPSYFREWRAANRETLRERYRRWRAANPEKAREAGVQWRSRNWPAVLAALQRRRARRRCADGTFTLNQWRARFHFYGGLCWICRTREAESMDHVLALCNGGPDWPANLRPACISCNSAKGAWEMRAKRSATDILEWAQRRCDLPR